MPKVMIWIRKEDYSIWSEIADKPAFLHDALHVQNSLRVGAIYPKVIKTPEQAKEVVKHLTPAQRADSEILEERKRRMGL